MATGGTALQNTIKLPVKVDLNTLRKAKQLVSDIKQKTEATERPLDKFASQLREATTLTSKFGTDYKSHMNEVNSANRSAATSFKNYASEVSKANSKIDKSVSRSSTTQSRAVRSVQTHMRATTVSAKQVGSRISEVGKAATTVTLGIGAGFAYSVREASKLQNQYVVIKNLAVTGGEKQSEAQKNVNQMQKDGVKYSEKYGVAQKAIGAGYETMVRRGYESNQALAAQKTYLEGAKASGDDYADVVENAASAIEQFGLKSKSTAVMTRNTKLAVNQMAYAADLTATSFKDLGEAMKYSGPQAKAANQSLHMSTAVLGDLSNFGIDGSTAGTSYAQILQRLGNMPAKGKAPNAMSQIGMTREDFLDAKKNMLPITEIFDKLDRHMKGYTSTQKGVVYSALFGANASAAANAIGESTGQIKALDKQIQGSQNMYGGKGYVAELAEKNMKSVDAQWKRFKQTALASGTELAKIILPDATKLLETATKLLTQFNGMPAPIKKMATYTVLATAAFGPLLVVVGKLIESVGILKTGFKDFSLTKTVAQNATQTLAGSATTTAADAVLPSIGSRTAKSVATEAETAVTRTRANVHGASTIGRAWKGANVLGKASMVGVGASIGWDAVKAIREGVNSKQGGKDLWTGAGTAVGGAIGSTFGPMGTVIGAGIGSKIASKIADTKVVKELNQKGQQSVKNYTKNRKKTDPTYQQMISGGGGVPSLRDPADPMSYRKSSSNRSNTRKSDSKSNSSNLGQQYADRFHQAAVTASHAGLNKNDKKYVNQAVSLETQANIAWAGSASKTYKTVKKVYDQLYQLAQDHTSKQLKSDKKGYDYLVKQGLLSTASAKSAYGAEKSTYQTRLTNLKKSINQLVTSDKSGGKNRVAAISKVNRQILTLTDAGGKKQARLAKSLNNRTQKLTISGYGKVIAASSKAYKQTVGSANKTYRSEVKTANARYAKEVSIARKTKGLSADQRAYIIKQAKKQRNDTISNAETQRNDTVAWATKQRKDVVAQAKKQAGAAVDAFTTAAGDIATSIPALLNSNTLAGLVPQTTKQKKNGLTNSLATTENPTAKLKSAAKTYSANTKGKPKTFATSTQKTRSIGGGSYFTGKAVGGRITRNAMTMVGENGFEVLQRGRKFSIIGQRGAQLASLMAGDRIYKHSDAVKMMNGRYAKRLANFAGGTTKLKSQTVAAKATVSGAGGASLKKTTADTKRNMKSISKSITNGYGTSTKNSTKKLSSFSKKSNSTFKNLNKTTGSYTNKIRKSTVADYDVMQKDSVKQLDQMQKGNHTQMRQMHKQMNSETKDMTKDYKSIMGNMDNYSHSAMSGAIKQLNKGFTSVNSVLSQFGGKKATLSLAHYAKGTRNGRIAHDQLAYLNDAKTGPYQEAVVNPDGSMHFPRGRNVIAPLKKGQAVLNGHEVKQLIGNIPHYAKGTGALRKTIKAKDKAPEKAFKTDFSSKLGSGIGTALAGAIGSNDKGASNSVGQPWYASVWKQFAAAMSGSGAGGNWAHTPGLPESNGFNASRGSGVHDGVDFSGPIGSAFKAVHGGTVIRTGGSNPWNDFKDLGNIIEVKSDDAFHEIYQEFGPTSSIGVSVGDVVRTGQVLGHLGKLAGHDVHVHVGVSKDPWHSNGYSHAGWYDVTKMHGKSSGTPKGKSKDTALDKYVKKQMASQIKWIGKNLSEDDASITGSLSGSRASKAKQLVALLKKAYSGATDNGAAAIIGNWMLESSFDSSVQNSIGASGLGQWLGGRFTNLKNYAKKHGTSWTNAGTQISFALHGEGSDSSLFKSVLGGHGSVRALATRFSDGWERGGYTAEHVADALKVAKMLNLNANGGWSQNGKLNIFGEVQNEPEVAINPKRPTADRLINQAISARTAVTGRSPVTGYFESQKAAKERKSLKNDIATGQRKQRATAVMPKVEVNNTFSISGNVSDEQTDAIQNMVTKAVTDGINKAFRDAFNKLGYGD